MSKATEYEISITARKGFGYGQLQARHTFLLNNNMINDIDVLLHRLNHAKEKVDIKLSQVEENNKI